MATECSYNGVEFVSLYKTSVSSKPVLDEAQRTTAYVEHVLTVEGFLAGGTDEDMDSARRKLTAVAGPLRYTDHGFGTLSAGGDDAESDEVRWGPVPEILEFKPLGGNGQAARITWRCTVRIPECSEAANLSDPFLELNYEVSFSIDGEGYTKAFAINGHATIPMTRETQGDRVPPDCVDRYRERLERRAVPFGFKRDSQEYRISADRRRLDFAWTDIEMPAALPREVAKIDMREAVKSTKLTTSMWTVRYSATITMARGVPKAKAVGVFLGIVYARTKIQKQSLWLDLEVDDDVFGRSTRFSLTIKHMRNCTLAIILKNHGMFDVAGDWGEWRSSMVKAKAWSSRGRAGLEYDRTEDAIIDLCAGGQRTIAAPPPAQPVKPGASKPAETKPPQKKDAADSWLSYTCMLRWLEDSRSVRHVPLPTDPVVPAPGRGGTLRDFGPSRGGGSLRPFSTDAGRVPALRPFPQSPQDAAAPDIAASADAGDATGAPTAHEAASASLPPDVVQKVAGAGRTVQLVGYGLRLGFRVPVPKLVSVGGVKVVEQHRESMEYVHSWFDGQPVNLTAWVVTYIVPEAPSGPLPIPANPWLDVSSTRGDITA